MLTFYKKISKISKSTDIIFFHPTILCNASKLKKFGASDAWLPITYLDSEDEYRRWFNLAGIVILITQPKLKNLRKARKLYLTLFFINFNSFN